VAWARRTGDGAGLGRRARSRSPASAPRTAAALRADLHALVADVAAHSVAPASGALWAPPRCGHPRPAADALAPAAPSVHAPPPYEQPAHGHTGGAPPTSATWRSLLSSPTGATQRELSLPAHEARRARLFVDLSGWARTGMAVVQGSRAALWLTAIPADRGGRGSFPGSAMRVAARLWLGAAPRPDPPRPCCSCVAAADAAGRHFLASCRAQVARRTAVHHHIVALVAAALRRAPQWGEVVVERPLDGSGGTHRPDVRATAAATAAVTCDDVSCLCRLDPAASTSERLACWWTPPGVSSRRELRSAPARATRRHASRRYWHCPYHPCNGAGIVCFGSHPQHTERGSPCWRLEGTTVGEP